MRCAILLTQFILTVRFLVVVPANLAVFCQAYIRCGHCFLTKSWEFVHLVIGFENIRLDFVMHLLERTCCGVKIVHKAKS
jgi:hypothetical protein